VLTGKDNVGWPVGRMQLRRKNDCRVEWRKRKPREKATEARLITKPRSQITIENESIYGKQGTNKNRGTKKKTGCGQPTKKYREIG